MDAEGMPNGHDAEASASPFADLKLSVDAYTLDIAAGKRRLKEIDENGTLVFEEPKSPRTKRTELLMRIWNSNPDGLFDVSEEELRALDPDSIYGAAAEVEEDVEEDTAARKMHTLMSDEEMHKLRFEVSEGLRTAQTELFYAFHLAKNLAASANLPSDPPPEPLTGAPQQKKKSQPQKTGAAALLATATPENGPKDPNALPVGTLSAVHGAAPERSPAEIAYALEQALSARAAALDDCAALIDAAVDELQLMNDASSKWASHVRGLRNGEAGGQWAVIPKPDFGRTGERAKDVVIPYALDEAPPGIHAMSLAAFDLDPRKVEVAFGARTYHRIRVRLRTGGAGGPQTRSMLYDANAEKGESTREIASLLSAAQLETLDADLFDILRAEAGRIDGSQIEQQNLAVPFGQEKLIFQMYDSRETPSPNPLYSPQCDALLTAARLGMLNLYRRRKARLLETASITTSANTAPSSSSSQPSIFLTIVNLLQFQIACKTVRPVLEALATALRSAGISATLVERHAAADGPDAFLALLSTTKVDKLGVLLTLEVAGCPGVSVSITAPSTLTVTTPRATFPLRDPDTLGPIVSEALSSQLSHLAYSTVRDAAEDPQTVFFDELDGVVIAGALGCVKISIPAPYESVKAELEEGDVPPFDSAEAAQSWEEWLADVGRAVEAR